MKASQKHKKHSDENKDKSGNIEIPAGISGPQRDKKRYPFWFYLVLAVIPLVFFVLLEAGLRLANYGRSDEVFIRISRDYPNLLFLNPEIPFRYFSNIKTAPSVIPDGFESVKKDTAYRIFVMGESSAAGWPYAPNASFSRYLKRKLTLLYPDRNIEVVNLGMSAVSTYTMRDLLPSVLEQKPDLIIFYNGHNEYYGALGAASTESLGKSRRLINFVLGLQRFRTVVLIRNVVKYAAGVFHSQAKPQGEGSNETLMAKMVGDNLIPLNSSTYTAGLEQFEGNMRDMLEMTKKAGVPVVLGTVACNLKDQHPFVSVDEPGLPRADKVYQEAKESYEKKDYARARMLFAKARELDALRFRAPEAINDIIKKLAGDFNYPVADAEQDFDKASPGGITGSNLMVDHLHPNLKGYQLLGESYYKVMKANALLPYKGSKVRETVADSILAASFPFTRLDSTIADFRLRILLGAYPFVPKGSPNYLMQSVKLKDFVDTMAAFIIDRKTYWEKAHLNTAKWFYGKKQYRAFEKEMNAIIAERPFNESSYGFTADMLVTAGRVNEALPYLRKLHQMKPGAFTAKWLGAIALAKNNYAEAVYYLELSLSYSQDDPQVWYNLSGAYYNLRNTGKAVEVLRKCLTISPGYRPARIFYAQLINLNKQNR